MLLVTVVLLVAGLVHRPAIGAERDRQLAQAVAARAFILRTAPAEFRANIDQLDSVRLGSGQYRTCVPGADVARAYCVFVFADQRPPAVQADPERTPNAVQARSPR